MADESSKKPDFEKGVYPIAFSLDVGGYYMLCESDLIFLEGLPFVVLEWGEPPENPPRLSLPLDPAQLEESHGMPGYFQYSGRLVDPRKRH